MSTKLKRPPITTQDTRPAHRPASEPGQPRQIMRSGRVSKALDAWLSRHYSTTSEALYALRQLQSGNSEVPIDDI